MGGWVGGWVPSFGVGRVSGYRGTENGSAAVTVAAVTVGVCLRVGTEQGRQYYSWLCSQEY